jgi:hypothetical protein
MADFSSYVSIAISSLVPELRLGSAQANSGYWQPSPPQTIAPGTTVNFRLHDPSGPYGSDGSVSFIAAGVTLNVEFACPYWSSNNGGVNLVGANLALDWYAQSDSNGWNQGNVPGGGHPLYIAVFVRASSEPKHPPPA